MENLKILMAILILVIGVFGAAVLLIPYLVKKGINISGVLCDAEKVLDTANVVVDSVQAFLPENAILGITDKVIEYAKQAVAAAEQLYKTSQIPADGRKDAATKIVFECLELVGVEVTDEVRKVVDGCVEAAVFALPKTHILE